MPRSYLDASATVTPAAAPNLGNPLSHGIRSHIWQSMCSNSVSPAVQPQPIPDYMYGVCVIHRLFGSVN